MRRPMATVAILVSTLGLVSGCGEDTSASDAGDIETVEITSEGGTVTPDGERVEVESHELEQVIVQLEVS